MHTEFGTEDQNIMLDIVSFVKTGAVKVILYLRENMKFYLYFLYFFIQF